MRSIMNLALSFLLVLTFASCSSNSNVRSVANTDKTDEVVKHEFQSGKRLFNETNY